MKFGSNRSATRVHSSIFVQFRRVPTSISANSMHLKKKAALKNMTIVEQTSLFACIKHKEISLNFILPR
jgi:hypothetical protein